MSYRVRKGDTLLGIADQFSVDSDDVKKWNRLKTNHVARGMVLRIYTQGGLPETASSRSHAAAQEKDPHRRPGRHPLRQKLAF